MNTDYNSETDLSNGSMDCQEIHYCKNCGKPIAEVFGSGLYCSRSCANSRFISDQQKIQISITLKSKPNQQAIINKQHAMIAYRNNPNYCSVCGKVLPYEDRKKRTCSEKCRHEAMSNGGKNKF